MFSLFFPWLRVDIFVLLIECLLLLYSCNVGFLQLAGGTNAHTVAGLKKHGLFQTKSFSGVVSSLIICSLCCFPFSVFFFFFPSLLVLR